MNQEAAARRRVDELLEQEKTARRASESRLYATDIHLAQQAIDKDNSAGLANSSRAIIPSGRNQPAPAGSGAISGSSCTTMRRLKSLEPPTTTSLPLAPARLPILAGSL